MDSFSRDWQRWFPEDSEKPPVQLGRTGQIIRGVVLGVAGLIFLFIIFGLVKGFYTEWLWFDSLGYGSVYTTVLNARLVLFFVAAIVFGLLLMVNLVLAARLSPQGKTYFWPWSFVSRIRGIVRWAVILGVALLSLIFGIVAQGSWQTFLRFFHSQPFNISDPVFGKDVSFYVFSLPLMETLRGWFLGALIVILLATAGTYLFSYAVQRVKFDFNRAVLLHVGGLVVVILGLFAWGYWLGIWELVFSTRGVVSGASFADIHAKLPAQWILLVVVMILIFTVIISIFKRKVRWPLYALGGWILAAIIVGAIYPALIQRFQVVPSELARERSYIEYNIEFTRQAFGLTRIDERDFPAEPALSSQDITDNQATINNVRLWDHRPLKDTYNQLQSIRLYYDFNDVDIDRYVIEDDYRQVMLSARELSAEKLAGEAQTWVNRKLQFTHGYGVVLSPVNEITGDGLPNLMLKDIPPVGVFDIERPEIYFGEKTNDYVVVKSNTPEFDYPRGDENVYGRYEDEGGVGLNGFFRRLIYAWQLGDFNLLISGELNAESHIMYYRNIQERVGHLAPFLILDNDPYMVIIDGKLYWIQDAYTTTDRYPYSEMYITTSGRLNYIRNSVKVVIDAYTGDVIFYVSEPGDPLIQTYQAIFPDMFVPWEQMPESFRVHLRYPEDMFNIQATVYRSYHMKDAQVFYNKEDLWAVPREVYAGQEQAMEPYYVIMRLPGEEQEEFLLMLPFTPVNKNNTIGWLAARCDGDNYGKLLAYNFPKDKLVYGPSQIENRIQQDTVITEQLALWGRGGSRVIRGNLLLIPIEKSNLYVEPVFLQADAGGLPELKRVIVAIGDNIVMEPSLMESLEAIFGMQPTPTLTPGPTPTPSPPGEPMNPEIADLAAQAQRHYDQAQQALRDGDWSAYGEALDALQEVIEKLVELTSGE